jgi:hypothetical protein
MPPLFSLFAGKHLHQAGGQVSPFHSMKDLKVQDSGSASTINSEESMPKSEVRWGELMDARVDGRVEEDREM